MGTYSDYEQRLLDQQSGTELDRHAARLVDHVVDVMHKPPAQFVIAQVHVHGWKPSYLSAYDADGSRSFRHEESAAVKFKTRAAAERLASRIRKTWHNEAGWQIEVREAST